MSRSRSDSISICPKHLLGVGCDLKVLLLPLVLAWSSNVIIFLPFLKLVFLFIVSRFKGTERLVRPRYLVAGEEPMAETHRFHPGPVPRPGGRQAAVHPHAQDAPSPDARHAAGGHAGGLLHRHLLVGDRALERSW